MVKQVNDNNLGIECQWMKTRRLLINPDGQVLPCCFFANVVYMFDKLGAEGSYLLDKDEDSVEERVERRKKFQNDISKQIGDQERIIQETKDENILMDYYRNKDEYNIHQTPLEDIVTSEWFTKTLPESWDDKKTAPRQCQEHCMKK